MYINKTTKTTSIIYIGRKQEHLTALIFKIESKFKGGFMHKTTVTVTETKTTVIVKEEREKGKGKLSKRLAKLVVDILIAVSIGIITYYVKNILFAPLP